MAKDAAGSPKLAWLTKEFVNDCDSVILSEAKDPRRNYEPCPFAGDPSLRSG